MRLIDADALKETIASNVYMVVDYFNSKDFGMFWTGGIERAIDEQPTIEKRGQWKVHGEPPMYVIECSVCGQKYFNHAMQALSNYCSNCGARMDGGADNGKS